ncbi:hypothetical protein SAMN05216548_11448 [Faunimonas pinastri]|uniref:Uncharacterized protein n=1 Tax=Faunimonas pinastri TaxID=1855383 RepID=A0A1H9MVJ7_9HYPH|nr:hypothetical protein [Faunimonas pinastri]SER27133.1 hypothetical protein SAMN05216548_11448 [Faunimonas pinastri]
MIPENIRACQSTDVPICVECLNCHHKAVMESEYLLSRSARLHPDVSLVHVSRLLKCGDCGSKALKVFRPPDRDAAADFIATEL